MTNFFQYLTSEESALVTILLGACLAFLIREILTWYWKINSVIGKLDNLVEAAGQQADIQQRALEYQRTMYNDLHLLSQYLRSQGRPPASPLRRSRRRRKLHVRPHRTSTPEVMAE